MNKERENEKEKENIQRKAKKSQQNLSNTPEEGEEEEEGDTRQWQNKFRRPQRTKFCLRKEDEGTGTKSAKRKETFLFLDHAENTNTSNRKKGKKMKKTKYWHYLRN